MSDEEYYASIFGTGGIDTKTQTQSGSFWDKLLGGVDTISSKAAGIINKNVSGIKLPTVTTKSSFSLDPMMIVVLIVAFLLLKGRK